MLHRLFLAVGFVISTAAAQPAFRVRSDFTALLNEDRGWAAAPNAVATVHADEPFRLRFEIELPADANASQPLRLQSRRNAEAWTDVEAHDFPHPEGDNAKTPRVSIVSCAAFKNDPQTTDLLRGSTAPFRPGAGISLAERTPPWSGAGAHGEFEWPLVVRRFADNAVTNEHGDNFGFRLVRADGTPLPNHRVAVVQLAIPPRHVGGTFVETPGRIGPWRTTNGDLYFIMEPAETSNLFMMIKSSDGGLTWREVDGANRPPTRDLESVDARLVGDTIHIIHQVTRSARYHSFRTSDHPTHPDTWDVRAEQIGAVQSVAQAASLVVRRDGGMAAFYVGQTKVHVSTRPRGGPWREVAVIDAAVGPQAVLGADDIVHLAYYNPDGTVWYRRLSRDNTLSPAEQLASGLRRTRAEFVSVLPLVFLPQTNTAVIIHRDGSGHLVERRIVNHGAPTPAVRVTDRPVVQNAVDSQQPGADLVADGATLHVLFIEQTSRGIFSTRHDGRGWQPSTLQVDKILGSWVRGGIYARRDGTKVYGYVYDAGSDGGAGMNRFAEIAIDER